MLGASINIVKRVRNLMFYAQSTSMVIHQSKIGKRVRNLMFYSLSTSTVIHLGKIVKRVRNLMFYSLSTSTVIHQGEMVKRERAKKQTKQKQTKISVQTTQNSISQGQNVWQRPCINTRHVTKVVNTLVFYVVRILRAGHACCAED